MKFFTITKWEFKSSIKSRKFVALFFMQISILVLMLVFFNFFNANIASDDGVTLSPSLSGFAVVDVSDKSNVFLKNLNGEILKVNNLNRVNWIF